MHPIFSKFPLIVIKLADRYRIINLVKTVIE